MSAAKRRLAGLLLERHQRQKRSFARYRPTQQQAAFHAAGQAHRQRLLMAGNQLGKTWAGANEIAMHLTGAYPAWWRGRRFDSAVQAWLGSVSQEVSRATVQRLLLSHGEADPLNLRGVLPAGWQRAILTGVQILCSGPRAVAGGRSGSGLVRRRTGLRCLYGGSDPNQCHRRLGVCDLYPLVGPDGAGRTVLVSQ